MECALTCSQEAKAEEKRKREEAVAEEKRRKEEAAAAERKRKEDEARQAEEDKRKRKEEKARQRLLKSGTPPCDKCNAAIPAGKKFCPDCGAPAPVALPPPPKVSLRKVFVVDVLHCAAGMHRLRHQVDAGEAVLRRLRQAGGRHGAAAQRVHQVQCQGTR